MNDINMTDLEETTIVEEATIVEDSSNDLSDESDDFSDEEVTKRIDNETSDDLSARQRNGDYGPSTKNNMTEEHLEGAIDISRTLTKPIGSRCDRLIVKLGEGSKL